ncbi:YggT family protein [Oscillatoria sp. FACHB-1407]|uniref:YggT family protein n=1 Tax=Oscillatoria sp. FACHB-1407 TaxID=2692847 RepID=UPI001688EF0B|nr:YggT family protein [Oscillatoria sp. FACHB-1407]MBD2464186.1 YggT family protein [Oscillatoria sp. FACHB-1407]
MSLVGESLTYFLTFYSVLLLIRVLLTWFPNVNWFSPPFSWLSQITDPYLNIFRSIIPPLGGIDFSPMLAIFAIQLLARTLGEIPV